MVHRFPLKEIALQSGLSLATVDRAVHGRAHVSPQTQRRVKDAISELAAQETQLSARGRRLFVDFVIEAPKRFTDQVRRAILHSLPNIGPAVIRPRFHFAEVMTTDHAVGVLGGLKSRGSAGVCIKLRDEAPMRRAINNLNLPAVTMFTDIPDTNRIGYVGMDNQSAGATAAFLIGQTVTSGTILTTQSQASFQGEGARAVGFANAIGAGFEIVELTGSGGLGGDTRAQMATILPRLTDLVAVYSMGGGNAAILDTLTAAGLSPQTYVAHDLDDDNRRLLRQGKISFVLHHDIQADVIMALNHILAVHRLRPPLIDAPMARVQIITPANVPD